MPITRQEYKELISNSDAGEICFMFDPAQCKNFLLNLNNAEAESTLGNSLRFESRVVRTIVFFLEPASLLLAIIASFVWLNWWGLLIAPSVFMLWNITKSTSSGGRQKIIRPIIISSLGVILALLFQEQGLGWVVFIMALSLLYLSEKMLYALPVLFFSFLVRSNYELVNLLYKKSIDDFNRERGFTLMWHVETPKGIYPELNPKLPSRLFLTLYGFFGKK